MTVEGLTGLILAVTGLIGVLLAVLRQLQATHQLINSRMSELVEATRAGAHAQGMLDQQDAGRVAGEGQVATESALSRPTDGL